MKRILFTGSEKCKVFFSSAQIIEHLSGLPLCIFILRLCSSNYLICSKT